jgi:hypothetical protein
MAIIRAGMTDPRCASSLKDELTCYSIVAPVSVIGSEGSGRLLTHGARIACASLRWRQFGLATVLIGTEFAPICAPARKLAQNSEKIVKDVV